MSIISQKSETVDDSDQQLAGFSLPNLPLKKTTYWQTTASQLLRQVRWWSFLRPGGLLYVVLPTCLLLLPYVFFSAFDGADFYFGKETGAVENITAGLLGLAIAFCFQQLITAKSLLPASARKFSVIWLVTFGLGCIYFLGEEISWGQHLVGWHTPEAWNQINDQGETNLHNTSGLFDQIPRFILTVGIVWGGFIFPLALALALGERKFGFGHKQFFATRKFLNNFMPGRNCIVAGGCVLAINILRVISDTTHIAWLNIDIGEVKESLIAMFLLVYIVDFGQRTSQNH